MILVNCNCYAPVPPYSASKEDLTQILINCQDMFDDFSEDDLTQLLTDWEAALSYIATGSIEISDDWYIRALICICLRGLRGEECPNIINFSL